MAAPRAFSLLAGATLLALPILGEAPAALAAPPAAAGEAPADGADPEDGPPGAWALFSHRPRAFEALRADPREALFRVGALQEQGAGWHLDLGWGGDLPILHGEPSGGHLSLTARGLFSGRFAGDSPSFDLLDTDFLGGVALGYRWGRWAAEAFLRHVSSHLGDEPLDRGDLRRRDEAEESLRLLVSAALGTGRALLGAETVLHSEDPARADAVTLRLGLEWDCTLLQHACFVATELRALQRPGWTGRAVLRAGLALARPGPRGEPCRQHFVVEAFVGPSDLGQRWDQRERYLFSGLSYEFR